MYTSHCKRDIDILCCEIRELNSNLRRLRLFTCDCSIYIVRRYWGSGRRKSKCVAWVLYIFLSYIDGVVQDCSNLLQYVIAMAFLQQSCTKPSIYMCAIHEPRYLNFSTHSIFLQYRISIFYMI